MYDPPYFLLAAGLWVGIICCIPFVATLKQLVKDWKVNKSSRAIAQLRGFRMLAPYLGSGVGICVFLASCLQIFAISGAVAYALSVPVTIMMAGSVWFQFTRVLDQLEQRGSQGIDLDDLSLGKIIPQSNPGRE